MRSEIYNETGIRIIRDASDKPVAKRDYSRSSTNAERADYVLFFHTPGEAKRMLAEVQRRFTDFDAACAWLDKQ